MGKYNVENVTITKVVGYNHCAIHVSPGYCGITFNEVETIQEGDDVRTLELGAVGMTVNMDDEDKPFDILDENRKPTGKQMTAADLLQAVDSLYLALAVARDASEAQETNSPHGNRRVR